MQKQQVFATVVVVVAVVTGVFYLLSTVDSPSLAPIRRLFLQQAGWGTKTTATTTTTTTTIKTPIKINQLHPKPSPPVQPPITPQPPSTPQNTSYPPIPSLPPFPPFPPWLNAVKAPRFPYFNPALEALPGTPKVFDDVPVNDTDKDGKRYKIILYWNEAYGEKYFGFGYGHTPFVLAGCKVNTCLATGDKNRYPLEEVDAVMWHLRSTDRSLPKKRYPHTRYVFYMVESALYPFADMSVYNGMFNLTFTHRRDSDAYAPYGRFFTRRHPLPLPAEPINYAKGKTKMAAWFVSNCQTKSHRENLVKRLTEWIKVDMYGGCGSLKCENSRHTQCMQMLEDDYKFYLSFENSLCQDYVTEKFFGAMGVNVVPVVYGLGNYSAIAPPHSFIDALDFASPRALADYLLYLNNNDTAYNQYFWWKPYYHQTHRWAWESFAFCDLCERLHEDTHKSYDLKKWFIDDSHCSRSFDEAIRKRRD